MSEELAVMRREMASLRTAVDVGEASISTSIARLEAICQLLEPVIGLSQTVRKASEASSYFAGLGKALGKILMPLAALGIVIILMLMVVVDWLSRSQLYEFLKKMGWMH